MAAPAGGRTQLAILKLALLPFLLLALIQLRHPLDLSIGDQAQYVLHARAILAGHAYTDDGYIYTRRLEFSPQAYPPGLPVVVAAVEGVGAPLLVARLLMIASAVLFLYLAGRYLATRDDPLLGPASIVMCAFVPNLTLFATGLYSDFAFAAAAWGCFLVVDRPGEWSRRRIGALTLLGAVAIAFRTVAVALIPALVLYQAWRTWRYKEPWRRAIVPIVVWIGTYLAIDLMLPVTQGYAAQIVSGAGARPSVRALLSQLLGRVMSYQDYVTAIQLTPTSWHAVNFWYAVAAIAALAIGAVVWVRRAGVRFLFCFIVCYVGIILVMPWAIARFLWPFAPVIWFATLEGMRTVLQALRMERARAAQVAVLAAVSVALVATLKGPEPPALVGIGDVPQGRALYAALGREAAAGPVRVMTPNPRDAALVRGVSAMSVTPTTNTDSMFAEAESYGMTHAVVGSLGRDRGTDLLMLRAIKQHPERFRRVYANELFTLYRLVPTAPPR